MKDLKNKLNVVPALNPATVKTSVNGPTIDTFDYEAVVIAIDLGPTGDTLSGAANFEFDLQVSNDGTTWTPATDAFTLYALGTANGAQNTGAMALVNASSANPQVVTAGYIGNERYLRVSVVVTGTMANGTPMSAVAILGCGRHKPANFAGVNQRP